MKLLRRELISLLNKACPENVDMIVRRVAETEIRSVEELELVVSLLFNKALAEPHYCETYSDMVAELQQVIPEFPAQDGHVVTFRDVLLLATQREFELLLDVLNISADDAPATSGETMQHLKKRKDRALANIVFIGQLFLRCLLSVEVIVSTLRGLVGGASEGSNVIPDEFMIECLCELLGVIGATLEALPDGESCVMEVFDRLHEMKEGRALKGRVESLYSNRIQFAIQDLVDMRRRGWTKKSFKASAKTKDEIRLEQERDWKSSGRSNAVRFRPAVMPLDWKSSGRSDAVRFRCW